MVSSNCSPASRATARVAWVQALLGLALLLLAAAAPSPSPSSSDNASSCSFTVDVGTGQGFQKGILRGGTYFRWAIPETDPAASASVAGCAALCCATQTCVAFSLDAPWSLASTGGGCKQGQKCCCLASDIGPMRNNTYQMNITSGVVQPPPPSRTGKPPAVMLAESQTEIRRHVKSQVREPNHISTPVLGPPT
jgi:hypothetical protein